MPRRRSAPLIKLLAGGAHEPICCPCGGRKFAYRLSTFPMRHVSHCLACGIDQLCHPAPDLPAPQRAPPAQQGRTSDSGWLP